MKFKYLTKDEISKLPEKSGVYTFKKGKEFLYIGKAANIKERVKQHLPNLAKRGEARDETKFQRPQRPTYRDIFFINQVEKIGYIKTSSELADPSAHLAFHPASQDSTIKALILEAKLIKKYQPKYNIAWKDDKKYFYIGITKELFPRIFITHQTKIKNQKLKVKSEFMGPFVSGRKLKEKLTELRKIYPYRTCKTLPRKPCLWYYLGQCPAPCLFRSKRVEAYDISNIQGKNATGSMVTFINGKPDKNFYRRFKIRSADKPNDVAMIKQVLSRRLNHPEWGLPDLILIDGGKAQLNAALSITKIPAMALAKGDSRSSASSPSANKFKQRSAELSLPPKKGNRLYMKNLKKPILLKSLPREIFNLILQLRDEAHRFARKYHLRLREIDFLPKN